MEKEADVILHGHAHDFDDVSLMSAVLNGAKEILEGKYFQQEDHGICYVKENIQ